MRINQNKQQHLFILKRIIPHTNNFCTIKEEAEFEEDVILSSFILRF